MQPIAKQRANSYAEAGVSLLEVLIAISILGISFTAIFSGLSGALRTVDRIDHYAQVTEFAANKLNELAIDSRSEPGQVLSGTSDSGLSWRARTELVDERPGVSADHPVQLVRVEIQVSWETSKGSQSYALQTLRLRVPPPVVNP
ncbi:MAG TPA: type II secretion system protein [Terriglobia bacterium]|nr:type II secretion system protein [Terriglobia bacterium]